MIIFFMGIIICPVIFIATIVLEVLAARDWNLKHTIQKIIIVALAFITAIGTFLAGFYLPDGRNTIRFVVILVLFLLAILPSIPNILNGLKPKYSIYIITRWLMMLLFSSSFTGMIWP